MNRRSLFKLFGGAVAAYACPLPTIAAAPVDAVAPLVPTAVLTNALLDSIYAQLVTFTSEVWHQRYRESYESIALTLPTASI